MAERSGDETRERILQVSLTLIARQGSAATPLRQIAKQCGISVAALYYYYPAKDQLLADVLAPYLGRLESIVQSAPAVLDPMYVLTEVLELTLQDPDRTRIVANDLAVRDQPQLGNIIQDRTRNLRRLLGATPNVPGSDLLAQAALGVLTRPVLYVPNQTDEQARKHLIPAALRVLQPIAETSLPTHAAAPQSQVNFPVR